MLVSPSSMDVVTPVILSQCRVEAWLFSPWDAKLLKGAPKARFDCNFQSARSVSEAYLPRPSASHLHRISNCPLEIIGWLVGLFPTLCPHKGPSEKLNTAFVLERKCRGVSAQANLSFCLDDMGYRSF